MLKVILPKTINKIYFKSNERAKTKCFRAWQVNIWLVNTGGRDNPSDEFHNSQNLIYEEYDSEKNYDGLEGIVSHNAYEKKRALMKMIDVF